MIDASNITARPITRVATSVSGLNKVGERDRLGGQIRVPRTAK